MIGEVSISPKIMQCQHHETASMIYSRLQAVFDGFEYWLHAKKDNFCSKFDVL